MKFHLQYESSLPGLGRLQLCGHSCDFDGSCWCTRLHGSCEFDFSVLIPGSRVGTVTAGATVIGTRHPSQHLTLSTDGTAAHTSFRSVLIASEAIQAREEPGEEGPG